MNAIPRAPLFSREQSLDTLARVQTWIGANVARFAFPDANEGKIVNLKAKAFAELCLALHIARKFRLEESVPEAVRAFVAATLAGKRFLDIALSTPARTAQNAFCLLALERTPAVRDIARYYARICRPLRTELLPFQTLFHVYTLEALGEADAETAAIEAAALRLSALFNVPTSVTASPEGAYAFTHSVMYATRFGTKPVMLSQTERAAAVTYMDIEICKALSRQNIDVALELVLSRVCLFGRVSARDAVVVESATALIERKGYLRTPKSELTSVLKEGDPDWEWGHCYHTMTVFAVLLTVLASRTVAVDADGASEDLALAMDAVGTIYTACEKGDAAMAALVLSKLDELPDHAMPEPRVLRAALGCVEAMAGLAEIETL